MLLSMCSEFFSLYEFISLGFTFLKKYLFYFWGDQMASWDGRPDDVTRGAMFPIDLISASHFNLIAVVTAARHGQRQVLENCGRSSSAQLAQHSFPDMTQLPHSAPEARGGENFT
jgi:hypothetical protein